MLDVMNKECLDIEMKSYWEFYCFVFEFVICLEYLDYEL